MDYGRAPEFGVSVIPDTLAEARAVAVQADLDGLDYLAIQDHPYQPSHLETLTLMGDLLGRTSRISVVGDVLDLQLRPPVMLAKAIASLSIVSGGRVQLGIGGGASVDGIVAMGGRERSPRQAVDYIVESLHVLRAALDGTPVALDSAHHQIRGYQPGPTSPTPVQLWLGAVGPRMMGVTGRYADGWVAPLNVYVPPAQVPEKQALIDEGALAAGRHPADIRRIYNLTGSIVSARDDAPLSGTVDDWAETLAEWVTVLGFDTFLFWPRGNQTSQTAIFAREVVPAVRERVTGLRSAG